MYEEIEYIARSETTPSERPVERFDADRMLNIEQKINEIYNTFREENSFLRNKVYDLEKDAQVIFNFYFCPKLRSDDETDNQKSK